MKGHGDNEDEQNAREEITDGELQFGELAVDRCTGLAR